MRKKRANIFTIILLFVVIVILAVIAGINTIKKLEYEYKLATHPKDFSEYVEKYAEEYGVDDDLIYSIIKTESSFNPEAVSNVGARGLMQIMEETFDWIKFRLGDEETVYEEMFEPEMNIRYGTYLIDYLLEKFGDKDTAVAAYHSGAGCVSEWLTKKENSADGKRLDNIPSDTATHYVNKINRTISNYKELYA